MKLNFEVKRHRISMTQGEVEVLVNNQSIVRYGDSIKIHGQYNSIGGWGSVYDDKHFIEAAMRQYSEKIIQSYE